ncbi:MULTISPECIES: helix-turn-helix transcriptional regulator [Shewanella]
MADVVAIVGLSESTIRRKMDDGTFPRSVVISDGRKAFRSQDIEAWLKSLV